MMCAVNTARIIVLVVVVIAISMAHYLTPTTQHGLHALYRWFFHIPIILGSFWFGLRGGAGLAAFITVLYLPHVLIHWEGGGAVHWLEIVLYNVVGWVTGILAQQQRDERDRYRRTAEELAESTTVLLETEEQLRRADRLSVLGELSAGLAHEVRTPLASIRGAAEILSGSDDPAERDEFSAILVKEVDRLNRVVTDFLSFARPGATSTGSADPAAAAREVIRLLGLQAGKGDVTIEDDLSDELPAVALGEEALKQVLLNLVMNALQATDCGGKVRVGGRETNGGVTITVEDNGCGIPEDEREKVFEPFVTSRETGTGLGLSVVRRILTGHGATIEIGAASPSGTVVTIGLPQAEDVEHAG
jgi:signal transduction histidine kinase